MARPALFASSVAVVALAGLAAVLSGCSSAPNDDVSSSGDSSSALSTSSYVASDAVTYADDHWDDGVGECAEFVSHSLRAGHLNIPVITWVPTLYQALSTIAYTESDGSGSVSANAGDVVMFSDASGSGFCDVNSSDSANCGHVCLVTVAGSDASSILVDCHNNAHHEIAVSGLLGGEYSTFRVYRMGKSTGSASPAPAGTEACSTDADCNGGASESGVVCASGEGYCIKGCHSDDDCPGSETCEQTSPHWSCH